MGQTGVLPLQDNNKLRVSWFLMVNLPLEVQTILFAFTPLFSMLVKEPLPQL